MAANGTDKQPGPTAPGLTRLPPIGFWSYARQDDELSFGKLSTLRALLIHELQQQYGREQIQLFQDASTIPHGSNWEREIQKAIDASVFFIPIITPNFIQSEWCAREVELFLERERRLFSLYPDLAERSRIFPILFIDIDDVDPENADALAALQKLQWFDFRRYRHRSYEEAAVREALSELAGTIRSLLKVKTGSAVVNPGSPSPKEAVQRAAAETVMAEPPPTGGTGSGSAKAAAGSGPAPPGRPIETGDLLNHMFEVKRFIKAGGMGQVFEGSNIMTGERVAIKALLPALATDPKIAALFQREAMTLTRLNHEALVQYRALAKEPVLGSLYIVTEYVDGVDLSDALGKVERAAPVLRHLLGRLAAGLAAAHRLGAIHRDISPDNVMLPAGDIKQAKIIDFGIAKDLGGNLPTLIGEGFAGKLNYVAPEQLGEHGGEIGPWTDVYSLALVILAVAGGDKVDMSGSFADAIRKRRDGPDLAAAPEELRPLLADMLQIDPARRLRSMDEVIARLNAPPQPAALPPKPENIPAAAVPVPPATDGPETIVADRPVREEAAAAPPPAFYGGAEADGSDPLRALRRRLLIILIAAGIAAIVGLILLTRDRTPAPPPETEAVTLPAGARYRVLLEGSGPGVTPADLLAVRLRMHVNSPDAPVVREEGYSGGPVVLRPSSARPALAEALEVMREGGRYLVWLPAGSVGPLPAPFSAGDTAVLEIEVVQVGREVPDGAGAVGPLSSGPQFTSPQAPDSRAGSTYAATEPPAPRISPPQRTRANLAAYFTEDDYPAAAIRQGVQGTTGFSLAIGPDGRVSDCRITASSGSAALDATTCRILRNRARYTPARDSAGRPAPGTDSGRVAWRLPDSFGR